MLQNKLKQQPPRGCTYIQGVNPYITLQEIISKYNHFGHVIGVSITKMSISKPPGTIHTLKLFFHIQTIGC